MHIELNESDILSEFLELSVKCESIPAAPKSKPEWISKNRYSNIQPCKLKLHVFTALNSLF